MIVDSQLHSIFYRYTISVFIRVCRYCLGTDFFMSKQQSKKRLKFPLWAKALSVVLLSVTIVSVVAINFFSANIRSTTRNFYIEQSVKTADTLAVYVDVDNVKVVKDKVLEIYDSIPEEEKVDNSHWDEDVWVNYLEKFNEVTEMPEYLALMEQVKIFHAKTDAKYTCLIHADLEKQRVLYLIDDSLEEEQCLPGSFDLFTENDMTIYDHLNEGFLPEITNMPEYGYLASTARPIFDEHDEIVAFALVDLSMDQIIAKEKENTRTLIIILVSLSIGAILLGFLLVWFMIVRPMRKLTKVANEYTEGDNPELNRFAQVNIKSRDEIEDLSNSMKKMEEDIKRYIADMLGAEKRADEMKHLADRDALTGLNNKRAYFEIEERLNNEINKGNANFSITMIDLNYLKVTNDTYGHEKGDDLIVSLSELIKQIFVKSSIYRIGGDEFAVVSEDEDLKNIKQLEQQFKSKSQEVNAAIGVATFDKAKDNNVEDTFKRADRRMYEHKKKMKQEK